MRPLRPSHTLLIGLAGLLVGAIPVQAQEPADTLAPADSLAPLDSLGLTDSLALAERMSSDSLSGLVVGEDPRLTWLGDTLGPADTLRPKFSSLPEVYPDSLTDPYTLMRPGAVPAFVLTGDEFIGRGGFSLLDILESESLTLSQDIGGSGFHSFMGSPLGSFTGVQVVIDGVPVADMLGANWDLRQMPLESIARVAWYPGPQVAAWGGEGIGGVLSITTRRSLASDARSLLAFNAGSFDAQGFSGYFARPAGDRGEVFLAANFDDTEGFLRAGTFTRNQFVFKFAWRFGDHHKVEASRRGDGLSGTANRPNLSGTQDWDSSAWTLFYRGRIGPSNLRVNYSAEKYERVVNYAYRDQGGVIGKSTRTGLRGIWDARVGPVLVWGSGARVEADLESLHPAFLRLDGSSILEDPPEDDPEGAHIETPRIRTEWGGGVGLGDPEDRWGANLSVRKMDYGNSGDSGTSWQAEGSFQLTDGLAVRGSASKGVRLGDFIGQAVLENLASTDQEIHPLRDAEPGVLEKWSAWQAELEWSRPGWRALGRFFKAKGEDARIWAPPTPWLYFDQSNIALFQIGEVPLFNTFDVLDVKTKGFEAEFTFPLPWNFRGLGWYRYLDAKEDDLTGEALPYLPSHYFLGQLRYARRFFPSRDMLLEVRYSGRLSGERNTHDGETLNSYFVSDLLVQATIVNFTLFVSYKNLLDERYLLEESFFLPGREGFLGVNWRFHN